MEKQNQNNLDNEFGLDQEFLKDEPSRVALTSKAGGMVVRDLVAKGEQMIQNNSNQSK